jgi:hypothetical protein
MKMSRTLFLALGLFFLHNAYAIACDPIWVRATSGEIRMFGTWREFEPNAVMAECGATTSLPLYARAGSLFRIGTELVLTYDGVRLRINALAVNVELVPSPSGQEAYILNDGIAFRNVRIDVAHRP